MEAVSKPQNSPTSPLAASYTLRAPLLLFLAGQMARNNLVENKWMLTGYMLVFSARPVYSRTSQSHQSVTHVPAAQAQQLEKDNCERMLNEYKSRRLRFLSTFLQFPRKRACLGFLINSVQKEVKLPTEKLTQIKKEAAWKLLSVILAIYPAPCIIRVYRC